MAYLDSDKVFDAATIKEAVDKICKTCKDEGHLTSNAGFFQHIEKPCPDCPKGERMRIEREVAQCWATAPYRAKDPYGKELRLLMLELGVRRTPS